MSPLSSDARRALLSLARRAIVEAAQHRPLPEIREFPAEFGQLAGAFVSLHVRGRLRGCIGQLEPLESLAATVTTCAASAAMHDPRFEPVPPEEVPLLEIEISVLSPRFTVGPEEIEVGRHGLLISRGRTRGLLLPQVAMQFHWSPMRFLEETCRKAGLEVGAWRDPTTRVEAFTAEVFSEAEFPAEQARAS